MNPGTDRTTAEPRSGGVAGEGAVSEEFRPDESAPTQDGGADADLSRVARGSALNLLGSAVAAVCSFGLVAILTRTLHRAAVGVFFSTTSLFLVATSLGGLGTSVGLVYFVSRARATGRPDSIPDYVRIAMRPVLAVGVVTSVAMFTLSAPLARLTNPQHVALAENYLRVISLFILPTVASTALLSASRGLGSMRPYVTIEQVGRQLVQLAAVAVVGIASVRFVAWAWALPYALGAAATLWWWRSAARRADVAVPVGAPGHDARSAQRPLRRAFWRFSTPRALGSVILLLIQRVDIVLVGALAGAVQAAVFTAGTRFVVAGQMGAVAVALAVQPALAAALARRDGARSTRLFQTSAAWIVGVTWPLYLTFCLSGSVLLRVFGSGYGSGATVLLLVTLGMLVGTACGDVDSALTMSGRTMASLVNSALGLGVMLAIDIWLIPGHGAFGAAFGWAGALVAKNLAGLVTVWRESRLHPFAAPLLTMAVLNLGCFAAVPAAVYLLPLSRVAAFCTGLPLAGGAYLAGLWVLRRPLRLDEFRALRRRPAAGRAGATGGQS